MKVRPGDIDRFAAAPPATVRAALVFGPDAGRVREVADRICRAVVDDPTDPFRAADLRAEAVSGDPARLADEVSTVSLMGGTKLVRVRGAGNDLAPAVKSTLETVAGGYLLVIDAGDLERRGALRQLFEAERASDLAAIGCYLDGERNLEALVKTVLGERRVTIASDALSWTVARLGADRLASRMEIEKLALFTGDGGAVDLATAQAVIGDAGVNTLDDIADAVGLSDRPRLERALSAAAQQGVDGIPVLRAVQRHYQRLHDVAVAVRAGRDVAGAVKGLRPPPHFSRENAIQRQAQRWGLERVESALRRLGEAELACKSTGIPAAAVAGQCLIGLALAGSAGQRARR